jgi:dTDP-4-dehydrorhamnose 3,5-epimerase
MSWKLTPTLIDGCFLVHAPKYEDERGNFSETYKLSLFKSLNLPEMLQDNHLFTRKGGIRAMHWQEEPYSQAKLVNVIQGKIFDAVFDLRNNSKTFGQLATFDLTEESPMLFVPAGCAHGFQGVSDTSLVHYKTDKEYKAESQRSFIWNDAAAGIPWPITESIVSEKDSLSPTLKEILKNG